MATLQLLAIAVLIPLLPIRGLRRLHASGKVNSLWTGAPIINMGINARAERLLGTNARSLVFSTYYITENFDYDLSAICRLPLIRRLVPYLTFVWAALMVDRFHFYCDRGLLPSRMPFALNVLELAIYKMLGIQMFFWTYGGDVRSREATQALGTPNCCTDCTQIGRACICSESSRSKNIATLHRYAQQVFAMGDMIEYVPGSRNDLFFWPIDLSAGNGQKYLPAYPTFDSPRPVRIVHAPNHRMFKGTRFLEQAVSDLKREGIAIDLILVERVPNDKAVEIYRTADVIFDQCLVGFHGYFALESMALGKPVMCFIRKPRDYLLAPDECPIINTQVATLKEDLRRVASERMRLTDVGMRSRKYIEKYFSLDAFAQRLRRAYREIGVTP